MKTFDKLLSLAKKLRSSKGCPWDRKQTILSLAKSLEEESDEVLVAIRKKDFENLEEELGDLLFNIVMICQIAGETKKFRIAGVLRKIEQKIIARHSWVFGPDREKVKTAADALKFWRENKNKIKAAKISRAEKVRKKSA
ncbi:nucleotide pyrophosphohydrolase [Candidatus Gracilibacteria bacterium]|nr:nucleotide pyrophosphohydrolase [Candidatus Gracilibacteria bacterium]MCF7856019.1 nucleotide pyrophosphohydrolase [Candidatus Gracilibacteria bacterium]MCF7896426.1 nucleotide pyrophosphohydrolase [Candidatus Gracilibacteria bacterium]